MMGPDESGKTEKCGLKPKRRNQCEGEADEQHDAIGNACMDGPHKFSDFLLVLLPKKDTFDSPLCPIYCGLLHTKVSQNKACRLPANSPPKKLKPESVESQRRF
jgi:hypothetical protein